MGKPPFYRNKRIIAVGAAAVALVSLLAVSQISDASTRRQREAWQRANCRAPATANAPAPGSTPGQAATGNTATNAQDANRWRRPSQCPTTRPTSGPTTGSGATATAGAPTEGTSTSAAPTSTSSTSAAPSASATSPAPLVILGNDCSNSKLDAHTGFQDGNKCVSTEFGEVGTAANNPTLLIVQAPRRVRVGEPFTLQISTRNLVRDRFLAAAQGGYYKESSFLTDGGLVRGHFHTACRMLASTTSAPAPDPLPAFFVATEDGKGNGTPDTVTINVTGMPSAGTAQCASWAGDGSHRIPMMQSAKQTPAFDAVRITVQ